MDRDITGRKIDEGRDITRCELEELARPKGQREVRFEIIAIVKAAALDLPSHRIGSGGCGLDFGCDIGPIIRARPHENVFGQGKYRGHVLVIIIEIEIISVRALRLDLAPEPHLTGLKAVVETGDGRS